MSARVLRALAKAEEAESAVGHQSLTLGSAEAASAYLRAAEIVEGLAVKLDALAEATSISWARGAFQQAAYLLREGDDEAGGTS
jgi:arginine/lysine/ornithine decarboxylase